MKKIGMLLAMALIACGGLFAKSNDVAVSTLPVVQISGTLAIVNGDIAIKSGDKTYYIEGIQHFVGFIDGLKEGAAVKVEGNAKPMDLAPEYVFLHMTKLTFNGKDYTMPAKKVHEKKDGHQ